MTQPLRWDFMLLKYTTFYKHLSPGCARQAILSILKTLTQWWLLNQVSASQHELQPYQYRQQRCEAWGTSANYSAHLSTLVGCNLFQDCFLAASGQVLYIVMKILLPGQTQRPVIESGEDVSSQDLTIQSDIEENSAEQSGQSPQIWNPPGALFGTARWWWHIFLQLCNLWQGW